MQTKLVMELHTSQKHSEVVVNPQISTSFQITCQSITLNVETIAILIRDTMAKQTF